MIIKGSLLLHAANTALQHRTPPSVHIFKGEAAVRGDVVKSVSGCCRLLASGRPRAEFSARPVLTANDRLRLSASQCLQGADDAAA